MGNDGMFMFSTAMLANLVITANSIRAPKQGRLRMSSYTRNVTLHKLFQAFLPFPAPADMQDKQVHELLAYARKVEGYLFETAKSNREYGDLIDDKVKEEEERLMKKVQQQQLPILKLGLDTSVSTENAVSVPIVGDESLRFNPMHA